MTPINLPLLNGRKYIHGTTMFGLLLNNPTGYTDIQADFFRPTLNQVMVSDERPLTLSSVIAEFSWHVDNQCIRKWILDSGIRSTSIETFDESELLSGSVICDGSIWQSCGQDRFSLIQRIVALNKALLCHIFGITEFWFVRIKLVHYKPQSSLIKLTMGRRIGQAVFDTTIFDDGNDEVGKIRFVRK